MTKKNLIKLIENWCYKYDNYMTMMKSERACKRGIMARELKEEILGAINKGSNVKYHMSAYCRKENHTSCKKNCGCPCHFWYPSPYGKNGKKIPPNAQRTGDMGLIKR